MLGSGLKKLAEEFGFKIGDVYAYGNIEGYLVSFSEGMGYKQVFISYFMNNEENTVNRYRLEEFMKMKKADYKLTEYDIGGTGIEIKFLDKMGTINKIKPFLREITFLFKSLGVQGVSNCCYCGTQLNGENSRTIRIGGKYRKCDSECAMAALNNERAKQIRFENAKGNYGKGVIGAILGMIVGIMPWIVVFMFGFFVGYLGFLIGFCIQKGYELMKGKPGLVKLITVIVLSVFGVSLAQIVSYELYYGTITGDGAVFNEFISNLLMGYLFAGLGLFSVIRNVMAEQKAVNSDYQISE